MEEVARSRATRLANVSSAPPIVRWSTPAARAASRALLSWPKLPAFLAATSSLCATRSASASAKAPRALTTRGCPAGTSAASAACNADRRAPVSFDAIAASREASASDLVCSAACRASSAARRSFAAAAAASSSRWRSSASAAAASAWRSRSIAACRSCSSLEPLAVSCEEVAGSAVPGSPALVLGVPCPWFSGGSSWQKRASSSSHSAKTVSSSSSSSFSDMTSCLRTSFSPESKDAVNQALTSFVASSICALSHLPGPSAGSFVVATLRSR
mmetsp:Transcript_85212/g.237903  ORF Transcript_85212/g.237903 Transcript_85212/m.237903 type:complete len:273 (-) Transcript_85212:518-1336(-)